MNPRILVHGLSGITLAAILPFGLAACGNGDDEATATPTQPGPTANDIAIELTTGQALYTESEAVEFRAVATNTADEIRELEFATGQRFELDVEHDGELTWRWSDGRVFTQAIEEVELGPGESIEFIAEWDQEDRDGEPASAGQYTAVATLLAGDEPGATVEFEIAEG